MGGKEKKGKHWSGVGGRAGHAWVVGRVESSVVFLFAALRALHPLPRPFPPPDLVRLGLLHTLVGGKRPCGAGIKSRVSGLGQLFRDARPRFFFYKKLSLPPAGYPAAPPASLAFPVTA